MGDSAQASAFFVRAKRPPDSGACEPWGEAVIGRPITLFSRLARCVWARNG
jgi:hypothetical protein